MKKKLIAQSFGSRMKNGPYLSRLLDPPGTKGGPQAHFRRGMPKHPLVLGGGFPRDQRPFGPGLWLHPGPKGGLWSRVVVGTGTKGCFGGPRRKCACSPPLVLGGSNNRDK